MAEAALIDGKAFAASLRARIGARAADFMQATGRRPGLAVVLVGEDPASQVYVGAKARACEEAGIASFEHRLPAETSEAELLALVERLNRDPQVDGILVQMPLPGGLDEQAVIAAISPDKDVDGFHVINAGRLAVGQTATVPAGKYARASLESLSLWNGVKARLRCFVPVGVVIAVNQPTRPLPAK